PMQPLHRRLSLLTEYCLCAAGGRLETTARSGTRPPKLCSDGISAKDHGGGAQSGPALCGLGALTGAEGTAAAFVAVRSGARAFAASVWLGTDSQADRHRTLGTGPEPTR